MHLTISNEELEIEKIIRLEKGTASQDEFEVLAAQVQKTIEDKQNTDSEDEDSADSEDTEEDVSEDDDGSSDSQETDESEEEGDKEPSEPSESEIGTESLYKPYKAAIKALNASKSTYIQMQAPFIGVATEDMGDEDGLLKKLAKYGFRYGKVGLSYFAKGLLKALSHTLEGVTVGSHRLAKYIALHSKSYDGLNKKITSARVVLQQLQQQNTEVDLTRPYEKIDTIAKLKVGKDLDFKKHLESLLELSEAYSERLPKFTSIAINNIKQSIMTVIKGVQDSPMATASVKLPMTGLTEVNTKDGIITLQYKKAISGDRVFQMEVPDSDLDRDAVKHAYQNSNAGVKLVDNLSNDTPESARYLKLEEIASYLDTLEKLCKQGKFLHSSFKETISERNKLERYMSVYARYIAASHGKLTIEESLIEYISLKTSFIDKVITKGALSIHDHILHTVSAGLVYVKDSLAYHSTEVK